MSEISVYSNIQSSAFKDWKTITSVFFRSGCSTICQDAFMGCVSLSKINDNNKIKKIGNGVFAQTILSTVTLKELSKIGDGLSNINDSNYSGAFEKCSQLTSINIPNCIFIPPKTFYGCSKLINVNIENCSTIYSNVFNCKNLQSINAKNCKLVDCNAFQQLSNLKYVNIENCTSIGSLAFDGCTSLQSVNISKKLTIGKNAFFNCIILSDIDLNKCVLIDSYAFKNCISLTNVNLNNCIQINNRAFDGCIGLKEISLNMMSIGSYAFYNCKSLNKVYIKTEDVIPIGKSVFYNDNNNSTSIISNLKIYLQPGTKKYYLLNGNWKEYSNHMFELPGKNQIIYTTYNNSKITEPNPDNIYIIGKNSKGEDITGSITNHVYGEREPMIGSIEFDSTINNTITYLNTGIFKNNKDLTSICLPSNCKEIGNNEFEGCEKLDSFTPSPYDILETIGDYVFKDCISLKSFTIPNTVNKIGEGVFAGCKNIEKFEGKYVKNNGKFIVYYNKYNDDQKTLISVVPNDNDELGGRYYKISDIDSKITKLGNSCFHGCKELRRVDIPSKVKLTNGGYNDISIGDFVFEGCDNLREVHFYGDYPQNNFGKNAFGIFETDENGKYIIENGKYKIKSGREDFKIFIPDDNLKSCLENGSWVSIYKDFIYPEPKENQLIYYLNDSEINEESALENTDKFVEYSFGNEEKYIYFTREIKNNILSKNLFKDKKNITKVLVGEKITTINISAFENCTNLEYIYIPSTITNFGEKCFSCCSSLTRIYIPNSYNTMSMQYDNVIQQNDNVIQQKSKKSSSEFQDYESTHSTKLMGLTSFGNDVFYGCKNLKEFISYNKNFVTNDGRCYIDNGNLLFFAEGNLRKYSIPTDVNIHTIYKSAYKGTDITSIVISSNVSKIEESAFEGCAKLIYIYFNNVSIISKNAFKNCTNLGYISLPLNLTKIGESAFEGCTNMFISNPNIKASEIGEDAFKNCDEFRYSFKEDGDGVYIDGTLSLNKITCINKNTFYGCKKLKDIKFNNDITTIGEGAFYNCPLKSLTLPKNLETIGDSAFAFDIYSDNDSIDISIPNNVETIGEKCFMNSNISKLDIESGSKLKEIKKYAFYGCNKLTKANMSNATNVNTIEKYTFERCSKLKTVELPNSIKYIRYRAFCLCNKLSKITLPLNLLELEHNCLATNSKTNIYITTPQLVNTTYSPPKFTMHNSNFDSPAFIYNDDSIYIYPFGKIYDYIYDYSSIKPQEEKKQINVIPRINVPTRFYDIFINHKDWSIYAPNIFKGGINLSKYNNETIKDDENIKNPNIGDIGDNLGDNVLEK